MTLTHKPSTPVEIGGIGHSVKRHEDDRLIEGQGNFLDDHVLPGMLHMAILRSPVPHARINSIDTSAATALEGVVAVVTGELLAQYNLAWMPTLSGDTQAVLATDKVRFQGQEVAAVVATDPYIAWDALELIDVDYDVLPAITSPQQSLGADAVLIRDDKEGQTSNLVYEWESGDAAATEAAFAKADRVVALETFYPRSHPAPLETCGCLADVNSVTGQATIYMTSQAPHAIRTVFAMVAGLPGTEHPCHQSGSRRRVRQQGAGVPGLRHRDRGLARHREAGEVDRDPHREPDLHRVRARLPHER